jgi:hypothetical protein
MALDDRFVNPFGFQVTSYRTDAEVLTPEAGAQAPPVAVPAALASPPNEDALSVRNRGYQRRVSLRVQLATTPTNVEAEMRGTPCFQTVAPP